MTASASEPSRAFWTVGIAASLAVHVGAVGGAALLAGRYAEASAPTEIVFSDEASPSADAVRPAAAPAVPSEIAKAVVAERIEPSAVSQAAPEKAAAVRPAETVAASTPERAAASASAETVAVATSAERARVSSLPDAAAVVPGDTAEKLVPQQQPAVAVAEPSASETSVASGPAESASAIAAQDAAPATGDSAERVVALQAPETLGVAPSGAESVATAAPETVLPQAATTGSGAVASAAAGGAEAAQPVAPTSEVVTGVASETAQPSGEAGDVAPGGHETAETVRPLETALLVPARPNSVLGTEVDKPTDRYRTIVDFIRGYQGGDCFIALPAMDLDGTVTFQTFGRDKAREDAFRNALGAIDELKTEISSGDVADPQCLALAFARASKRYPGFSLVIDLNETEMASGSKLSGSVLNAEGRELHLMLVDDEGRVQSIDSFLSASEGADRGFSVPLTLTGGKPVATKQILVAITTDPPLPGLGEVNEPAADFFRRLAREIEAAGADVDLAVEGFDVR